MKKRKNPHHNYILGEICKLTEYDAWANALAGILVAVYDTSILDAIDILWKKRQ